MCSVFRASEVLNTTNSEPQCISCVLLCSVVFRVSEVLNTANSEPRCISSVVEILTEIGNVFSSEFSCSGIVGDWSWKCFWISSVVFMGSLHSAQ